VIRFEATRRGSSVNRLACIPSERSDVWARLVDAGNPALLMVVIAGRLGPELPRLLSPEDILQDTLTKDWRTRATLEWQGLPRFRRWFLRIAERCVEDERDRAHTCKRGGERVVSVHPPTPGGSARRSDLEPWSGTTPSWIAVQRERMQTMERALDSLPAQVL